MPSFLRAQRQENPPKTTKLLIPEICDIERQSSATREMKISGICVPSLLYLIVLAAKIPAVDKFKTYHSRSLSSTPLDIDDSTYENLTAAPRDYSIAVLLTATEAKFGCKLCRDFAPEWELVAKSWNKGDRKGDSRMLFSTLDFSKGKETFQKVGRLCLPSGGSLLMGTS